MHPTVEPKGAAALTMLVAQAALHTGLMLSNDHELRAEALPFLEKAVALNPDDAAAIEGLARGCAKRASMLRRDNRLVEAEKILRRALALRSGIADIAASLADILLWRAEALLESGSQPFKAESLLREALLLQPDLQQATALLASLPAAQEASDDPAAQEAQLRREASDAAIVPLVENLYAQAVQFFNAGQLAEAECAFRQALALQAQPTLVDSLVTILCAQAFAAFNNVRFAETEAPLWEALSLRPEHEFATSLMRQTTSVIPRYVHNLMDREYTAVARDLRRALSVRDVVGADYVRKGGVADGGYVMVNRGLENKVVYSLGIGDNVSWDMDMALLGCQIFQYDHTIEGLPVEHDNFHWSKLGIVGAATDDPTFRTLDQLIAANGHRDQTDMILKVDIETFEWSMFAEMPDETLRQFSQIVGEFHRLARVIDPEYREVTFAALNKLNKYFQLVHAHANNFTGMAVIGGVPVYYCMELTFVRRADFEFADCTRLFPTALDAPCIPKVADLFLGGFVG